MFCTSLNVMITNQGRAVLVAEVAVYHALLRLSEKRANPV